jgi:L-ribulose-5-phosphate 4-epimerase
MTHVGRDLRDTCVLCGKSKDQVAKLIVGLHGGICSDCIALMPDTLSDKEKPHGWSVSRHDLATQVKAANAALPQAGLVTMHSGNASGYLPEEDLVLIKPSGMDYDAITEDSLVPVRLSTGQVLDPRLRPSVDLPHHLFLYRNLPGIRGVVHTHSNYATAFAAVGRPIAPILTAIADEFGGPIPCAPYVDNEGDHIGEAILKYKNERAPAILLGHHGVFAWGGSPKAALKAAVMVEDVAKTVWLASQLEEPYPLPGTEIEKWYDRYQNRYGQK